LATTRLFAVAALLLAPALGAQTTRLVDPIDPAYLDLQRLVDAGLIARLSFGQRPLSRAAFNRALDEASLTITRRSQASLPALAGNLSSPDNGPLSFYRELVASLRERLDLPESTLNSETRLRTAFTPIRTLSLDITRTDQPTRLIPLDNGLGGIDGVLNTLLLYRQGRPGVDGTTALLETSHTLETDHFAFSATPQLYFLDPNDSASRSALRLQELQLRFMYHNVALDVGREYLVWGQGRDVGMLNSDNSPPLDQIRLSSEEPFSFPWLLRRLGPTRFSIFYADLGADQNFPHAYAIGYRANSVPAPWLELGFSVYTKAGGRGAPPATTTARLIDLLPFLDASAYNNLFGARGLFQFSDHYAGLDGRLRFPSLGSSFYWELLLNDFDVRRLGSVMWDDAGHVFGFDLPSLSRSGRLRASLEYHHTGLRYYEHQQFISGQTVHQMLTGDPLGPNAQGVYANIDSYSSIRHRLSIQLAVERRSNDLYAYTPEPHFGFTISQHRPKEWTGRALANWQLLPEQGQLGGLLQFGYERTRNFDFVTGADRNGLVGRVSLQYRFR
jgi:hypothetical protein